MSSPSSPLTANVLLPAHNFNDHKVRPKVGQIVKLRLSQPVTGPASLASSSAPTKSRNTSTWRSAIILETFHLDGSGYIIKAMPIPAFTAEKDPVAWMEAQPLPFRRAHLPVPTAQDFDPRLTPPEFGDRLVLGGFKDRIFSWVQAWPQTFTLKYSDNWKSFSPPCMCDQTEVDRLLSYAKRVAPSQAINIAVRSLFAQLGQDYYPEELYTSDQSTDSHDDSDDDDDVPDSLATMVHLWPNPHPIALQIMEETKRQEEHAHRAIMRKWIQGVEPCAEVHELAVPVIDWESATYTSCLSS